MPLALTLALLLPATPHTSVRGMTISCQTWGQEWGTDGFATELDRLQSLGVNWVTIHPYARIRRDGTVSWRPLAPESDIQWLLRPIREAHARGMQIMIKPHLAYWGSTFEWRGEIDFREPEKLDRFFATYERWIDKIAEITREADAFVVGTELDRLVREESRWRSIIGSVRTKTDAHLTYAANWSDYQRVGFWDALDAVGIQAYFPLSDAANPSEQTLRTAWGKIIGDLHILHQQTGKPIVFTELGYDACPTAAKEPWRGEPRRGRARAADQELQRRLLSVALEMLSQERAWLRGAFLWKWFAGPSPGEDFRLDEPHVRNLLRRSWANPENP